MKNIRYISNISMERAFGGFGGIYGQRWMTFFPSNITVKFKFELKPKLDIETFSTKNSKKVMDTFGVLGNISYIFYDNIREILFHSVDFE